MDTINMVTDKQELDDGPCIELLPGVYQGNDWNEDSVYFSVEVFALVEPVFEEVLSDYNMHAVTEVSISQLDILIERLDSLRNFVTRTTDSAQLNGRVGFFHAETEGDFQRDFGVNRQALEDMIAELVDWLAVQADACDAITILGSWEAE